MGFRGMMGGGADVETRLSTARIFPGGRLEGTVHVKGGTRDMDVNFIELALTARVEVETEDSEYDANVNYHKTKISGGFRLQEHSQMQLPFAFEVPFEAPFNVIGGQKLHQVRLGLRTELDISRSIDKTDVDPIEIMALPAQEAICAGFAQIGFRLKGSDLERGRLQGSPLPFYQEVEFSPPGQFSSKMSELEVKFVSGRSSLEVVLEIDRKSMFGGSSDKTNRFTVDYATAASQDWPSVLNQHLNNIMGGGVFSSGVSSHSAPPLAPPAFGGAGHGGYAPPPAPAYGSPPPAPAYGSPPPPAYGPPPAAPAYGAPPAPAYGQPPAAPPPYNPAPPPAPTFNAPPPPPAYPPPQAPTAAPFNPPAPTYSPPPPSAPPAPAFDAPPAPRPGQGGGINLSKGANVNLSQKEPGLTGVSVGLGWDVSGFGAPVDIDASAVVADASGRALSDQHFVFFNNPNSPEGAVRHSGDNKTGEGAGDDEQILVNLLSCPPNADRIAFAVSIHDGAQKGQSFGQIRGAYIRVVNQANNVEIARFDLTGQSAGEQAMIFGELYRHGGDWKFRAVGQGFAEGLVGIIRSFGLNP